MNKYKRYFYCNKLVNYNDEIMTMVTIDDNDNNLFLTSIDIMPNKNESLLNI
jgi:hypothetical protein